jgi:DNA topoisomerase-1
LQTFPSKELGVSLDGDFTPKYMVSSDKKKLVSELKSLAKKSETVWLASDEDREGEAIAWHLANTLDLNEDNSKRIVFSEITKNAILKAIETPRTINYDLVNAQQARRILDRLVGYELSPVLWRKVKGGLSAGRVQSVAVRLIVDQERAIRNFSPEQSYKTQALFETQSKNRFLLNCLSLLKIVMEQMLFFSKILMQNLRLVILKRNPPRKVRRLHLQPLHFNKKPQENYIFCE